MNPPPTLRQIILPTADLDASIAFYEEVLGLSLKFRNGDHYAALATGDVTIALVGHDDRDPEAGVAPALRTDAVEPLTERLRAAGCAVEGPFAGGHESRIELRDPSGNPLVIYAPLPD
jgi:catechol 2,3-dioxygenase-like lactoylglutathione lyase family enzyme